MTVTNRESTFDELNLAKPILQAIREANYKTPTPIQAAAIPHLLAGRDLLGCAQTGTGKTAAFALPILHQIDTERRRAVPRAPQILVLSPTRELSAQIAENFLAYGKHVHYRQTIVFGGVSQVPQVRALQRGVHIVIATPGRLLDLMDQGHLKLDQLTTFVLDEADRMLDMGFMPDLKRIIARLPADRQSLFFSATMSDSIRELASSLLQDPVRVEVARQASPVELIEQSVMFVSQEDKRSLLHEVLGRDQVGQTLVFTRTKRGADRVAKQLLGAGVKADAIHGDKTQNARNRVLQGFKNRRVQVLVATDVAARGIDVDGITHVINYDMPHEPECYVHRIGRTGRAGANGTAMSFCDNSEHGSLRAIEKLIRSTIRVDADHPFHREPVKAQRRPPAKKRFGGRRRPMSKAAR